MDLDSRMSNTFLNMFNDFTDSHLSDDHSVYVYIKVVNAFFLATGADPIMCTLADADKYFSVLSSGNCTLNTVRMRLAVLRSLRQFALDNYLIPTEKNIFAVILLDNQDALYSADDMPTLDELTWLLNSERTFIFNLIIRCGLTTSEIVALRRRNFVADKSDSLLIYIPGTPPRYLALKDETRIVFEDYLSNLPFLSWDEPVLLNSYGKPMLERTLQRVIKETMCQGIEQGVLRKSYTASRLRAAGIACMLAGGATMEEAAKYAGITTNWLFRLNSYVDGLTAATKSII